MAKQKQTPQGAEVAQGAQAFSLKEVLQTPIEKIKEQQRADKLKWLNDLQNLTKITIKRQRTAEEETERKDLIKNFKLNLFERTQEIADYVLFNDFGVGLLKRGTLCAVVGREKAGKSFFASIICASVLGCKGFGLTNDKAQTEKILIFDTEQDNGELYKLADRLQVMTGLTLDYLADKLAIYPASILAEGERLAFLQQAIEDEQPTFVVVDVVSDFVSSVNEEAEAKRLLDDLQRLAVSHDCTILATLHLSKTSGEAKGHLGSLLRQKCTDMFELSADGDIYTAENILARGKAKINKISYHIEDTITDTGANIGIPKPESEIVTERRRQAEEEKREAQKEEVRRLFGISESLKSGELVAIISEVKGMTQASARNYITKLKNDGLITSDGKCYNIIK